MGGGDRGVGMDSRMMETVRSKDIRHVVVQAISPDQNENGTLASRPR